MAFIHTKCIVDYGHALTTLIKTIDERFVVKLTKHIAFFFIVKDGYGLNNSLSSRIDENSKKSSTSQVKGKIQCF